MVDNLAIINRAISEHHAIGQHIKLVGDSVNDLEAFFSLQQAYAAWTQSSIDALAEKREQMQKVVMRVDEGLRRHFGFEEEAFPALFGDILMKALLLEHQTIREALEKAKISINETRLEELPQKELLSMKSQLQQILSNMSQLVTEHAASEELILKMMKRALEHEIEQAKQT